MARNTNSNSESLGELYARIGLDFDDLNNSFVQVERSLNQNIGRLNRANRVIDIQQRVELLGLDESADAERIFETRTRNLNRTLENERTRLRLLQDSLEDTRRRTGATSDETQRAEIAFENARLSVARLENQLQELNEQHAGGTDWTESIVAFSQKAAPVISVARAIFQAFGAINDATTDLIEKFRELQKNAYNFNLPLDKADDFARKIRLAGGELEDIGGYLRGMTDALVKGETDDPEFIALQRYNETIFDATGKLKSYYEIWETVHRAFKKAQAEGKEIEFLQMTGGESGVTDAIQALNRWEQAIKDANDIVKANIDYKQLEQADRVTKKLTEQTDEFGKAIADAFSPATTKAAETLFDVIKAGTQWLVDHKADLKNIWETPSILLSPLESFKHMAQQEKAETQRLFSAMKYRDANLKKLFDTSAGLDKAHADLKKRSENQSKEKDPFQQYAIQRTKDLKDAIADLRLEIDYEDDYQKAVAQAQLERERALRQIVVGDKERAAIEEKYRTDIEKAEKDHADKLEDIWKETAAIQYETSHSAFEKEIFDIEQWKKKALDDLGEFKDAIGDKNKWLQESAAITANALAKETQAFEKEIDRINGKVQSLAEKVFDQEANDRQKELYKLAKEISEYSGEGIYNPELIQRYANNALQDIDASLTVDLAFDDSGIAHLQLPGEMFKIYDTMQAYLEKEKAYAEQMLKPAALANLEKLNPQINALKPEFDTSNIQRQLSTIEGQTIDFKANLAAVDENFKISTSYFESAMLTASNAATAFSNSLATAADYIAKLNFQFPDLKPQNNFSILPSLQTPNSKISSPSTPQPIFKFGDNDISAKTTAELQRLVEVNEKELPNIVQALAPLDKITSQIADITSYLGNIAKDAAARQAKPKTITLAPSINLKVDLGGAYVFDDRMKAKLTDDVTTEIVNQINEALTRATNNLNTYFG